MLMNMFSYDVLVISVRIDDSSFDKQDISTSYAKLFLIPDYVHLKGWSQSDFVEKLNLPHVEKDDNDFHEPDEEMSFFDVCPQVKSKPLLSDSWVYNISRVGQKFYGGVVEFRDELVKYSSREGFA